MGVSSWARSRKRAQSAPRSAVERSYATGKRPQADTRDVNHSPLARRCEGGRAVGHPPLFSQISNAF